MRKFYLTNNALLTSKHSGKSQSLMTNLAKIYRPPSLKCCDPQHEAVYSEARDLLNQWVAKSLLDDGQSDSDVSGIEDLPLQVPTRLEIKKEWDHFLKSEHGETELNQAKPHATKMSRAKAQIALELQRTKYVENRVGTFQDPGVKQSPAKRSTLDRILQRQEEAKARRELRRQEAEARKAELAIQKQANREALQMVKQLDETMQREQRREEELVRLEMIRIRKQLEDEKERANRERCRDWLLYPVNQPLLKENEPPPSPPSSLVPDVQCSQNGTRPTSTLRFLNCSEDEFEQLELPSEPQYSAEDKLMLRHYFSIWRQRTHQTRIRINALAERADCRLQRTVLRAWKLVTIQTRFDREVKRAKEEARLLERKEIQATDFHSLRLLRTCFVAWQTAHKLFQLERAQDERAKQRHVKETEFLEQLKSHSVRSKMTSTNTGTVASRESDETIPCEQLHLDEQQYPVEIDEPRKIEKCTVGVQNNGVSPLTQPLSAGTSREQISQIKPKPRTVQSALERPNLPSTLIKQRQRIAQQNREIEELKSAKRYTELLLEAKAHALADQLLEQAGQQALRRAQSAVSSKNQTFKAHSLPDQNQSDAPSSARSGPCLIELPRSIPSGGRSSRSEASSERVSRENLLPSGSAKRSRERAALEYPKDSFLQRMEQQAAERARLKAEREERRRLLEQRKKEEMARQLEEEAKRAKEERRAFLAAQRAKQREEEERKREHMLRLARLRELEDKADRHLAHQRIVYYGMLPWKRLIIRKRAQMELAEHHAKYMVMRTALRAWLRHTRAITKAVTEMIERVRNQMLLRRALTRFRLACELTRETEQQANAWYEQELMRRTLSTWSNHVTEIRIWEWQLEDVAHAHWTVTLKRRCLTAWCQYPQLMREERERERRRERLRGKLRDLVPDFSPPKKEDSDVLT